MNVFVHLKSKPGQSAEHVGQWWGAAPVGGSSPEGLVLLSLDVFDQQGEAGAQLGPHRAALMQALRDGFAAEEVAALSEWEFEFISNGALLNAVARKQGLVVTSKTGIIAAAPWPEVLSAATLLDTVNVAHATLDAALAAQRPAGHHAEVWS